MTTIVTEYTANNSLPRVLSTLGVKYTEQRLDDKQVQFEVDVNEADALAAVALALQGH